MRTSTPPRPSSPMVNAVALSSVTFVLGILATHDQSAFKTQFHLVCLGLAVAAACWGLGARPGAWLALTSLAVVPVALRLLEASQAWSVGTETTPLIGALVGAYACAGWHADGGVREKKPALQGVWADVLVQARRAQNALQREVARLGNHDVAQTVIQRSTELVADMEHSASVWANMVPSQHASLEDKVARQLEAARQAARGTTDGLTAAEYARTADALNAQLEAVGRIKRNHERALARLQCQLTLLETARLTVVAYAAQDAALQSDQMMKLAQQLESASEELDLSAGAMEQAQEALAPVREA